jgi:phosphoglycerate dehydrogenase-like enzyme
VKIVYLLKNPGIASRTPAGWKSAVISSDADGGYTEDDLLEVEDADFLAVGLEPVGEEIFDRAPRLRLVQRLGRGHNNIDLEAAARRGVPVCTMPDFNAATVAEHTLMLMLALLRRVFESTLLMKAGRWPVREVVGSGIFDLQGKVVGLVGLGAIGRAVAIRLKPFDARVLYYDLRDGPGIDLELEQVSLELLLRDSDIVSLHVPLTTETRGLIGGPEIATMKRTALLINTARGALVDEVALADALQKEAIAGAALDVFSEEPLDPLHPLRRCGNTLLTPHTAGQTREAMERMVAMMLENMQRVSRGEEPEDVVASAGRRSR